MKNKTAILAALFFFVSNAHYAQLAFPDYPLLLASHDQVPYYAIGAISATKDHPTLKCTGTLVAPAVVLTAAHCLYDLGASGWKPRLYFFPSTTLRDGGVPVEAKRYVVPKRYAANKGAVAFASVFSVTFWDRGS